ncbi:MAG: hypothetical protein JWR69_3651 [Pedosphaera sp.]|jgi:hypothetical protein|nr:hypothetical protein [Pedosphaera sp.]
MTPRLPSAKIVDLVTTLDTAVIQSASGPMVWGTVDISYASEGLEPRVSIKVPVPAFDSQSDEQRRTETLRRARKLIHHACVTMEPQPGEASHFQESLVGLAEELGILSPTASPTRSSV